MATSPANPAAAEEHLRATVDVLRTSGSTDRLPRGLLARAEFHRAQDNLELAQRDLDEVRTIVRRTGMRLFEADLELEQTRWHLANNDPASARNTLDKAKDLVDSKDYGRRRPEVKTLEAEIAAAGGTRSGRKLNSVICGKEGSIQATIRVKVEIEPSDRTPLTLTEIHPDRAAGWVDSA